jgi:hypothetical protein
MIKICLFQFLQKFVKTIQYEIDSSKDMTYAFCLFDGIKNQFKFQPILNSSSPIVSYNNSYENRQM